MEQLEQRKKYWNEHPVCDNDRNDKCSNNWKQYQELLLSTNVKLFEEIKCKKRCRNLKENEHEMGQRQRKKNMFPSNQEAKYGNMPTSHICILQSSLMTRNFSRGRY